MDKKTKFNRLAQTLLATTCLTAATVAVASAGTVDESAYAGGFGADFATATALPTGTDTVTGGLCDDCGNSQDWFEIPGLTPGDTIQVTGSAVADDPSEDPNPQMDLNVVDSSENPLGSASGTIPPTSVFDVTAPSDGELFFEVEDIEDGGSGLAYTVSIVDEGDPVTPEPGTAALGTLALAATALRRKLKKA